MTDRSDPGPEPVRTPPPTAAALPGPPPSTMIASAGAGTRAAYALVARCNSAAVQACELRLFRREIGPGAAAWTAQPLRFEIRSTTGAIPSVLVGADDRPMILDLAQQYAYTSVGGTFVRRRLAVGPEIDRVPPGSVLIEGRCADCQERLVVVDAVAGLLRPLRTQPPVGTGGLRTYDRSGDRIWVVSGGGEPATGAVSPDGGRSWRRFAVPRTAADGLEIVATPDGGAYLVGTRFDELGNSRLAGMWRAPAAGTPWRQLRVTPMPTSVRAVLAGTRGLLVVDARGSGWRLGPDGGFDRLPDSRPARPDLVFADAGPLLVAMPRNGQPERSVLTSVDQGESWQPERIPD